MQRETKSEVVKDVGALVKDASVIVRTDFTGVTVEDMTKLRAEVRKANGKYRVVKNTLAKIAFAEPGMDDFTGAIEGPSGFAFGFDDDGAVGVCKALKDFSKENKHFEIKDGWLLGKQASVDQIKAFADLPGRDQLVAMLLGVMQSPIRNLVTVLGAPIRNLVMTVKAVADQKGEGN